MVGLWQAGRSGLFITTERSEGFPVTALGRQIQSEGFWERWRSTVIPALRKGEAEGGFEASPGN